ncbi:type II toxin-antitoxin system RelE/ParE family toxin [Pseudodesulfovibrio tunisiensis]|uniref:type II toxin-antitoxin system RelE/ParE family toxin n=1 Tax=Pseudodesulfovibrio tunisiensis TaxID=463192 RepID=UPI001FB52D20|nr:type II toxin-antitoxin system RelE/ParE family toxin [Pseudodesulfovibrio tunisiensis]
MNSIKWTESAYADLTDLMDYFRKQGEPGVGKMLVAKIHKATGTLRTFPHAGRAGLLKDTRELVIPHIPYFLVYQVQRDVVNLLRVMHTSKLWTGNIRNEHF